MLPDHTAPVVEKVAATVASSPKPPIAKPQGMVKADPPIGRILIVTIAGIGVFAAIVLFMMRKSSKEPVYLQNRRRSGNPKQK